MPATPSPPSQLYSRWDHQTGSDTLIVCFNGCAYRAQGRETRLELFGRLAVYGTSTLWFAEGGERRWFLDFDRRIQDILRVAALGQGIRRVLLVGASAGGYAAIRHAALLQDAEAELPSIHVVVANPQTGFGPALLDRIRGRLAAAGWPEADLGRDPILPAAGCVGAAAPGMLAGDDLAALLVRPTARRAIARIDVHHDAVNPIDSGFAAALAVTGVPFVHLRPQVLGKPHSQGCGPLMQSAAFVASVESALGRVPTAPRKPYLAILRAVGDAAVLAAPRNFDVAFSLGLGAEAPTVASPVFVHRQAGPGWPALAAALKAHWDQVRLYRQVWLPDAGVTVDVEQVSTLFAVCDDLQLELAQPALLADAPAPLRSSSPHAAFQVRFTNGVDARAPVLSSTLLARVLPLLSAPAEPEDLVRAWALCLRPGRMAIVDATPLRCTGTAGPVFDAPVTLAGLLQTGDTVCACGPQAGSDTLLAALTESPVPVAARALAAYVDAHLDAWAALAARRPPGWLCAALNESLGHAGLRFAGTATPATRRAA